MVVQQSEEGLTKAEGFYPADRELFSAMHAPHTPSASHRQHSEVGSGTDSSLPQFNRAQRKVDNKNTIYMDYISLYLNCYSSHTLDNCISNCYLSINHVIKKFLWSFNK